MSLQRNEHPGAMVRCRRVRSWNVGESTETPGIWRNLRVFHPGGGGWYDPSPKMARKRLPEREWRVVQGISNTLAMPYTILVVDDDEMVRTSLEVALNLEGYAVRVAPGGISALEELGRTTIDLVVLDITMPDLDGWETLERMRQMPAASGIPVIALSGDRLEPQSLRRAGFNAYLSKGGSLENFLCTIRWAIEVNAGRAALWLHSCNGDRCFTQPLPGCRPTVAVLDVPRID